MPETFNCCDVKSVADVIPRVEIPEILSAVPTMKPPLIEPLPINCPLT